MASATSAAVTGRSCKSSVRHACIPGWWTVHRAAMNRGRAGYSPMDPTPPPYTVDLLCADHELGREPIHRTRLHPHAQSLAGSHSEDWPECVPVPGLRSGDVRPGGADGRRRPPSAGERDAARCRGSAATTARRRTPHRHACPYRHACPRRMLALLTAPAIRSGIDFHSTAHGHVPVGPHSVAACGRLVPTAPPGSPVPVGRFCAAPVAAPSPTLRPDEIGRGPRAPATARPPVSAHSCEWR